MSREDRPTSAGEEPGSNDHERDADVTRRRVLRSTGAAAVGTTAFAGLAEAHGGKEISWVAFCGCSDGFCIRWRRYTDGELISLAYEGDCTVYYKAGKFIYEHQYTRNAPSSDVHIIETGYAGEEDPVASRTPSDSRDPCGIIGNTTGTKLEKSEIESYEYDCPNDGGSAGSAQEDDGDGGNGGNGGGGKKGGKGGGGKKGGNGKKGGKGN